MGPLRRHFRIVAFDLRGHGGSSKPEDAGAYSSPALWADDLRAVMDATDLSRPTVAGWSFGGVVLMMYLARHGGDRIGGVNMVCSTADTEMLQPGFIELAQKMSVEGLFANVQARAAFLRLCLHRTPEADDWHRMLVVNGIPPSEVIRGLLAIDGHGLEGELAKVENIVVTAGRHDAVVRVAAAERIVAVAPQARLSVFEDAGHAPFIEESDRFNAELIDAFARRPGPRQR